MKPDYRHFYDTVMEYYGEYGRHHLPWRVTMTPYRVVVSEIMLQQTQVDRVIPFFNQWMKSFPSWKSLAEAKQSDVLKHWKGLGYNSRALRLHQLAKIVSKDYRGILPKDFHELVTLPGIGPYTAGAVRAFAFNVWTPFIETNIRRVFIHHFFKDDVRIGDKEIFAIMDDMGEIENPREWYTALMDYGASLPKIVKYNPNTQSKHYTKQSKFEGSDRQIRGQILDILLQHTKHRISEQVLFKNLGKDHSRYEKILIQLEKEGFIKVMKNMVILK